MAHGQVYFEPFFCKQRICCSGGNLGQTGPDQIDVIPFFGLLPQYGSHGQGHDDFVIGAASRHLRSCIARYVRECGRIGCRRHNRCGRRRYRTSWRRRSLHRRSGPRKAGQSLIAKFAQVAGMIGRAMYPFVDPALQRIGIARHRKVFAVEGLVFFISTHVRQDAGPELPRMGAIRYVSDRRDITTGQLNQMRMRADEIGTDDMFGRYQHGMPAGLGAPGAFFERWQQDGIALLVCRLDVKDRYIGVQRLQKIDLASATERVGNLHERVRIVARHGRTGQRMRQGKRHALRSCRKTLHERQKRPVFERDFAGRPGTLHLRKPPCVLRADGTITAGNDMPDQTGREQVGAVAAADTTHDQLEAEVPALKHSLDRAGGRTRLRGQMNRMTGANQLLQSLIQLTDLAHTILRSRSDLIASSDRPRMSRNT